LTVQVSGVRLPVRANWNRSGATAADGTGRAPVNTTVCPVRRTSGGGLPSTQDVRSSVTVSGNCNDTCQFTSRPDEFATTTSPMNVSEKVSITRNVPLTGAGAGGDAAGGRVGGAAGGPAGGAAGGDSAAGADSVFGCWLAAGSRDSGGATPGVTAGDAFGADGVGSAGAEGVLDADAGGCPATGPMTLGRTREGSEDPGSATRSPPLVDCHVTTATTNPITISTPRQTVLSTPALKSPGARCAPRSSRSIDCHSTSTSIATDSATPRINDEPTKKPRWARSGDHSGASAR
jgi:hypothetical protein